MSNHLEFFVAVMVSSDCMVVERGESSKICLMDISDDTTGVSLCFAIDSNTK